jgi:hypothetical protein
MGSMVVRQMGAMGAEMLIRRAEMDYPAGEQKDARIVDYVDQVGIETFEKKCDAGAFHAEVRSARAIAGNCSRGQERLKNTLRGTRSRRRGRSRTGIC